MEEYQKIAVNISNFLFIGFDSNYFNFNSYPPVFNFINIGCSCATSTTIQAIYSIQGVYEFFQSGIWKELLRQYDFGEFFDSFESLYELFRTIPLLEENIDIFIDEYNNLVNNLKELFENYSIDEDIRHTLDNDLRTIRKNSFWEISIVPFLYIFGLKGLTYSSQVNLEHPLLIYTEMEEKNLHYSWFIEKIISFDLHEIVEQFQYENVTYNLSSIAIVYGSEGKKGFRGSHIVNISKRRDENNILAFYLIDDMDKHSERLGNYNDVVDYLKNLKRLRGFKIEQILYNSWIDDLVPCLSN